MRQRESNKDQEVTTLNLCFCVLFSQSNSQSRLKSRLMSLILLTFFPPFLPPFLLIFLDLGRLRKQVYSRFLLVFHSVLWHFHIYLFFLLHFHSFSLDKVQFKVYDVMVSKIRSPVIIVMRVGRYSHNNYIAPIIINQNKYGENIQTFLKM